MAGIVELLLGLETDTMSANNMKRIDGDPTIRMVRASGFNDTSQLNDGEQEISCW